MNTAQSRISYLSAARIIGLLLVIFGHSYPFGVSIPKGLTFLQGLIYSFHMPLFVFLSGFLAAKSKRSAKDYISKRANKLLIPYFALSVAAFLPKFFVQQYLNDTVSFSFDYFLRSELIPRQNVWGHFWFLPVIFYLGVLSVFMRTTLRKYWVQIPVLVGSFLLLFLPKATDWLALEDLRLNMFWYVLGFILSNFVCFEKVIQNKWLLLAMPVAIVLLQCDVQLPVLPAILMIAAVLCLSTMIKVEGTWLANIEHNSFVIFLLSWPVQAVTEIVCNRILKLPVWFCMAGMFICGVAGPMICIWVIKRLEKYRVVRWMKPTLGM